MNLLLISSLSENYVELHVIKMEHHNILCFLFVLAWKRFSSSVDWASRTNRMALSKLLSHFILCLFVRLG